MVGKGHPQRVGTLLSQHKVAGPHSRKFGGRLDFLVSVLVHKSHHSVAPGLEPREREVTRTIRAGHEQRRLLGKHREAIELLGHRIAELFQVLAAFAFGTHQEQPYTRERLLAGHRIVHQNAARDGQGIYMVARREHHMEWLGERVAMQVLDATRKRNRVGSARIELRPRSEFHRAAVHLELHLALDWRRNRHGSARDRRIDPLVEFQLHVEFFGMVRRVRRGVDTRNSRRELIFGPTARRHLRRASQQPDAHEQRDKQQGECRGAQLHRSLTVQSGE